jgi:hypothetical protein
VDDMDRRNRVAQLHEPVVPGAPNTLSSISREEGRLMGARGVNSMW